MSESSFYHITREGKLFSLKTLADALAEIPKGGFVWLDYTQPTKEELSLLIEPFGLHPLSIEDCLDENLIPKIDDYPRYTFFIFNAFSNTDQAEILCHLNDHVDQCLVIMIHMANERLVNFQLLNRQAT